MDVLDRLERAARMAGVPTDRPTPKSLGVDLEEGRRVVFRRGGGSGCLRASVTVGGEPEAEMTVTVDRAIRSVTYH